MSRTATARDQLAVALDVPDLADAESLMASLDGVPGWLKIGAELFTSQKLVGVKEREGTRLLKSGQEGYTVLGQLYGKIKYGDHVFTGYRHELALPYVNKNDSRMTPRTFEGYTVRGQFRELLGQRFVQPLQEGRSNIVDHIGNLLIAIADQPGQKTCTVCPPGLAAG